MALHNEFASVLEQWKRAEDEPPGSEARIRALMETSVFSIFILQNEKLVYVNPHGAALTGYTREELMNMTAWDVVHPKYRELVRHRELARQLNERAEPRYEFEILRKDGAVRWIEFSAGLIQYRGKWAGIGTAFDVTDRKRTEQVQAVTYRISEATLQTKDPDELYGSIHAIVGELMPAKNFYIALYDRDKDAISFPYFVDEHDRPPAPRKAGKGLTEYVLRTGRSVLASPEVFRGLVDKGEVESIGVPSIDWLGVPLRMGERIIGIIVVQSYSETTRFSDEDERMLRFVSSQIALAIERKQAGEAVGRLSSAVELSPDSIVIFDLEGRIVDINRISVERWAAANKSDLIGRSSLDLVVPEYRERALAAMADVLGSGLIRNREFKVRNGRGEVFPIEVSVALMKEGKDRPSGFVAVCRDITERKLAEERLNQSLARTQSTLKAAISSLSSAIELRDPYTAGHQERVTRLATAIAQEMGLSADAIEGTQIAGIIHDIGKLHIPAEILSKPTALTRIEYELMKTHAEAGYHILSKMEFPWPVAEIVHQHHERLNGSGYPRGLAGRDILVEARILAVADIVEAMSSHRPYRPALGLDRALAEIEENRSVLYDSGVVNACLRVIKMRNFRF